MLLKKTRWLVYGTTKPGRRGISYDGNSFKRKSQAEDYLLKKQLDSKDYFWEIQKREYPLIPIIRRASDYNKIMFKSKYEVVSTSGSVDVVEDFGMALCTWIYLTCPKLLFLAYKIKKKFSKKKEDSNNY